MFFLTPWRTNGSDGACATQSRPFESIRRLDEVFSRIFGQSPARTNANWGEKLNETEKEYLLAFDAPGFEANEFDFQINSEGVAITAEHKVKEGEQEFVERAFSRSLEFGTPIDPSKVEAKYRNGVLYVRLPKAESAQWRKIEVRGE